jgi:hypothetical protein
VDVHKGLTVLDGHVCRSRGRFVEFGDVEQIVELVNILSEVGDR